MPPNVESGSEKLGFVSSRQDTLSKLRQLQTLRPLGEPRRGAAQSIPDTLLSLFAPAVTYHQPESYQEELAVLSKLLAGTAEVVEKGILTEREAQSVMNHVIAAFVGRRMDQLVHGLFSRTQTRWYLAASHVYDRIGHASKG